MRKPCWITGKSLSPKSKKCPVLGNNHIYIKTCCLKNDQISLFGLAIKVQRLSSNKAPSMLWATFSSLGLQYILEVKRLIVLHNKTLFSENDSQFLRWRYNEDDHEGNQCTQRHPLVITQGLIPYIGYNKWKFSTYTDGLYTTVSTHMLNWYAKPIHRIGWMRTVNMLSLKCRSIYCGLRWLLNLTKARLFDKPIRTYLSLITLPYLCQWIHSTYTLNVSTEHIYHIH